MNTYGIRIPIPYLNDPTLSEQASPAETNREVTFEKPFECVQDADGTMHFGHIAIKTTLP